MVPCWALCSCKRFRLWSEVSDGAPGDEAESRARTKQYEDLIILNEYWV
jgi:hypothetical protein